MVETMREALIRAFQDHDGFIILVLSGPVVCEIKFDLVAMLQELFAFAYPIHPVAIPGGDPEAATDPIHRATGVA